MPRERADAQRASFALGGGAAVASVAYDPAANAADAKRALILVVALAALALTLASPAKAAKARRLDIAPGAIAWLGFVAWSALSLAWGVPSGTTTLGTWVGASGLLAASMALSEPDARRAASVAGAAIGGASGALAVAQLAAGARGIAIHGGHGNPNWLGLVLSISLPLSLDLTLELRKQGARSWMPVAAATALMVPGLWLSHSRVAWAATAASLIVFIIITNVFRGARAIAASALACALALHSAAAAADPSEPPRLEATAPGAVDAPLATAWDGRVWIWTASADAAKRALPLGEGLGGFPEAYLDAQGARLSTLDPKSASRRFLNATTAHCDWIEAAVSAGIPGLALLIAAIGGGIVAFLRARGAPAKTDAPGASRWPAGAAALVAFVVCAAGDSPMHQPSAVVLVALTLGAAPRTSRAPSRGLVLAGCAALLATSLSAWICARRITRANEALPDQRIPLLVSAARVDPRSGEAALALGLARLALGDAERALGDLTRSRALLANIGTDVAIGNARMAQGQPERAVAAYARALARHPGYLRARANIAEALISLGRLDEASTHLSIAQSLWPGNPKLALIAEHLRKAHIEAETWPGGGTPAERAQAAQIE